VKVLLALAAPPDESVSGVQSPAWQTPLILMPAAKTAHGVSMLNSREIVNLGMYIEQHLLIRFGRVCGRDI
jgi:hypothetical protein